jgi:hypothetical protein
VLGPKNVAQLEDVVREVGVGPLYLREVALSHLPRISESAGIET